MQNDSLADALTRIRNAIAAGQAQTKLRFSKKIYNLVQVLISEKLVTNAQEIWENEQHYLVVNLVDRNLQVILSQVELAEQTVHRLWTVAHRLWTAAQDRSPKRAVFHAAAILARFDVGVE